MHRDKPERISAQAIITALADSGSFISWDTPICANPSLGLAQDTEEERKHYAQYRQELLVAEEKTGLDEAVVTGEMTIAGRRVAVIVNEFDFLAGSVGVQTANRLMRAVQRATAEKLPLLSSPTSGGTRMQEGVAAFVQMVKISAAVTLHKKAGLPFLVYLRDPTFGGVYASWGSLAHVTAAQPRARIGFLGPRVYENLYHKPFPSGVQTAENFFCHGLIDGIVPLTQLRDQAIAALTVLCGDVDVNVEVTSADLLTVVPENYDIWESVNISRNPLRPSTRSILNGYATDIVPLSGTNEGEYSGALVLSLARFGGHPCIVLGHDRHEGNSENTLGPAALREARRGMRIAAQLSLPLVLIIDTSGATLSPEAEEHGLSGEIARCLADLSLLETATCSVILGQGAGGAALAFFPADIVLCAQNAWLSPLPPEGASAVIFRDTEHAKDMARLQKIGSVELLRNKIIDGIIAEPEDPAANPQDFINRVGSAIAVSLRELYYCPLKQRLAQRLIRYQQM